MKSGDIALEYFNNIDIEVQTKPDKSPVTAADKKISALIRETLENNFQIFQLYVKKSKNRKISHDKFWLIDPIDGTKDFINKRNEFTINIGLIKNNIPVFGILYAPKIPNSPLYYIDENNKLICFEVKNNKLREVKNSKNINKNIIRIVTSKRCKNEDILLYLGQNFPKIPHDKIEIQHISSSFKFCQLLEEKADIFLNLEPTMEWDSAAGHALAINQKIIVLNPNKTLLKYNKESFKNDGFIAISKKIQEYYL